MNYELQKLQHFLKIKTDSEIINFSAFLTIVLMLRIIKNEVEYQFIQLKLIWKFRFV